MNLIDKIKRHNVNPTGLKHIELPFVYSNLKRGNCLIVGEHDGIEGVSATVLDHPDIELPIICTDIVPISHAGCFIDEEVKRGRVKHIQCDFINFTEDVLYDNIVCVNVLEHFGFPWKIASDPEANFAIRYDLLGFTIFRDNDQEFARTFTYDRLALLNGLVAEYNFIISSHFTTIRSNSDGDIHTITEEEIARIPLQEIPNYEMFKFFVFDKKG